MADRLGVWWLFSDVPGKTPKFLGATAPWQWRASLKRGANVQKWKLTVLALYGRRVVSITEAETVLLLMIFSVVVVAEVERSDDNVLFPPTDVGTSV